ncbi:MAG: hypothetical protein Kow0068_23810 [Marinilabiliales bacterium]
MKTHNINSKIILLVALIFFQSCGFIKTIHQAPKTDYQNDSYTIKWDDSNYDYDKELDNNEDNNVDKKENNKKIEENNYDKSFTKKYSKILGIELDGTENKKLIKEISEWLGTKYQWAGETKQKGTDCSGMTKQIYKTVYNKDIGRIAGDQYNACKPVSIDKLKEGDLVFFKINSKNISHVGIYIKDGYFVHASTAKGVIISNLSETYYKKYFFSGGRPR